MARNVGGLVSPGTGTLIALLLSTLQIAVIGSSTVFRVDVYCYFHFILFFYYQGIPVVVKQKTKVYFKCLTMECKLFCY